MKKKNSAAKKLGKLSAAARKKKYKIKDWSAHMKAVRKGTKTINIEQKVDKRFSTASGSAIHTQSFDKRS